MYNPNRGVRIHIGKEETGVRFPNMIEIFAKIGITVANGMTEGLDTEIPDGQTLMMLETGVIKIMMITTTIVDLIVMTVRGPILAGIKEDTLTLMNSTEENE